MDTYKLERTSAPNATVYRVAFGDRDGTNVERVRELAQHIKDEPLNGGGLLLIDGSQSIPVAYTLGHAVAHLFGAVAVRDPKLEGIFHDPVYIICVTHDPRWAVGDVVYEEK